MMAVTENGVPAGMEISDSDDEQSAFVASFMAEPKVSVSDPINSNDEIADRSSVCVVVNESPRALQNKNFSIIKKKKPVLVVSAGDSGEGDSNSLPNRPLDNIVLLQNAASIDLKSAIASGNVERVLSLIESGNAVNTAFKTGWSPLMVAVHNANFDIAEILIRHGANVSYHLDGFTVLMAACCCAAELDARAARCIQLLLKNGARLNVLDRHCMSALLYAARNGLFLSVQAILTASAEVDHQDSHGYTALMWAAARGYGRIVRTLLDAGANPNVTGIDGQTAWDLAYTEGHEAVARLIQSSINGEAASVLDKPSTSDATFNTDMKTKSRAESDVELLLRKLKLSQLLGVFRKHRVERIAQFLALNDHDLSQMGIQEIGIRKTLLQAITDVHKKRWENTSLLWLDERNFTCNDGICMLSNVNQHLSVIESSLCYIRQALTNKPTLLLFGQQAREASLVKLVDELEMCENQARQVASASESLKNYVTKMQDDVEFARDDLIGSSTTKEAKHQSFVVPALLGFSVVGIACCAGIFFWARRSTFVPRSCER